MTGLTGNSEFGFPKILNVPLRFTLEKIEGLGVTKLTVSLGHCVLFHHFIVSTVGSTVVSLVMLKQIV